MTDDQDKTCGRCIHWRSLDIAESPLSGMCYVPIPAWFDEYGSGCFRQSTSPGHECECFTERKP
jgi:hypothetical protein